MQEKKLQKEHEQLINVDYLKKWMQISEEDANKRKQLEDQKL